LRKIKLDGMSVYSFWFENLKMPYENIKWEQYLDLDDNKVKLLKNDLGNNIFTIDKDILFKEYWLWFIKHLKKIN
jgi:CRISPR-associated protein Csx10